MLEESANRVSRKEDVERNMSGAVKKVGTKCNTNVNETEESLCQCLYYIATH
jgi:hypothetical protein